MAEFGTVAKGKDRIGVTHFPNCKRPCLFIGNGCVIQKVATFNSEEHAEGFYRMLLRFLDLQEDE